MMFNKIQMMAARAVIAAKCKFNDFVRKENGDVNIVSLVVLIGIAVLLAIIFRKAVANLINGLFNTIRNNANNAIKEGAY